MSNTDYREGHAYPLVTTAVTTGLAIIVLLAYALALGECSPERKFIKCPTGYICTPIQEKPEKEPR